MLLHVAVESVLRQTGGPRFVEPLLEGSPLVGPSIVIIARRNDVMLVVGSALQNDREFSGGRGTINVSTKYRAVTHFCLDAVFDGYCIRLRGKGKLRNKRDADNGSAD